MANNSLAKWLMGREQWQYFLLTELHDLSVHGRFCSTIVFRTHTGKMSCSCPDNKPASASGRPLSWLGMMGQSHQMSRENTDWVKTQVQTCKNQATGLLWSHPAPPAAAGTASTEQERKPAQGCQALINSSILLTRLEVPRV